MNEVVMPMVCTAALAALMDLARRRVVVGGGEGAARFCATFRVMRLGCRLPLRLGMFFRTDGLKIAERLSNIVPNDDCNE